MIWVPFAQKPNSNWQTYSQQLIKQYEVNQTPYFIDITAKWCVTCQTNKLNTLNKQKTIDLFESNNIQLIVADWTNHDESITNLLGRFNQISIPTYIYFDGSNHIILTDIISYSDINNAIK